MKNTSFERIEKVQGDIRTEEAVVHQKKRYGHGKLKILSVVLAFLIWLVLTNVDAAKNTSQGEQASCQPTVEDTVL